MVVARWARPAVEHAQDVPLVGEARSGLYFMVSLCRVSLYVQTFVTFSLQFFSFLFLLCPFFKSRIICFGFDFRLFCVSFGFNKT